MHAFTALADPTRLRIIELLAAEGALGAGDIHGRFNATASAISQHLKILKTAGLVTVKPRAQQRIYHLNTEKLREIERWAELLQLFWEARYEPPTPKPLTRRKQGLV